MDFQQFVDTFFSPACVVSVERKENGGYGEIRIVSANSKYIEMIDTRIRNESGCYAPVKHSSFIPDTLYSDYFPSSRGFEDACFRAAVQKEEIQTYVHLSIRDIWFDVHALPMDIENGNICYCAYTSTIIEKAETVLNRSNTIQASGDVLAACIKLHKADNLRDAMEGVISEIREICKAEGCTVLKLNEEEQQYSIVATDFRQGSTLKRVTSFPDYYKIAASWKNMIGEEGDCIIIQNEADMEQISRINNPWYQTLVEAGVKSVVLFPLIQGSELLGFIWATNFDTKNTLRIKETLELTTFFISSHIARYNVVENLERMSYTDMMTGLPNNIACRDNISRLIRNQKKFAVVSVDLNHFKSVNHMLGIEAGNQAIKGIADRWKAVREKQTSDVLEFVARVNGDEFSLVICGYRSTEELVKIIMKYSDALSEPFVIEGCDIYITASFGFAEYPSDGGTADTLISRANTAANELKKVGSSDHILKYSPEISQNERMLEIENQIRTALENNSVFFHLQPQYDMKHELRGFEALARMKDSDGSIIRPDLFIPVAEKVGLIDKVDEMVFRKAAAFFSDIVKQSGKELTLSLNASVRHIMKKGFIAEISDLIEKSGISPSQLEIEITESILMDSADKALQRIGELKAIGIKLAIDDFGTGYSSLSYLNKIPADLLKIDKSFIDRINTNESSKQYVAAMISMGHIMGLDVISEGVEQEEQLAALRSIGCDLIQGFIWGKPLPPEDVTELVMGGNSI